MPTLGSTGYSIEIKVCDWSKGVTLIKPSCPYTQMVLDIPIKTRVNILLPKQTNPLRLINSQSLDTRNDSQLMTHNQWIIIIDDISLRINVGEFGCLLYKGWYGRSKMDGRKKRTAHGPSRWFRCRSKRVWEFFLNYILVEVPELSDRSALLRSRSMTPYGRKLNHLQR